jgi:hypothetical protein
VWSFREARVSQTCRQPRQILGSEGADDPQDWKCREREGSSSRRCAKLFCASSSRPAIPFHAVAMRNAEESFGCSISTAISAAVE